MSDPKDIQPGDLLDMSRVLRRLLAAVDDSRYVIDGSFTHIDRALEELAVPLRKSTQAAASSVYQFLDLLEQQPSLVKYKQQIRMNSKGGTHG